MSSPISTSELAELGYDSRWLEWGFLDAELFREQLAAFRAGEDANTEHYRYPMFLQYLARDGMVTTEDVERYLTLAAVDPDPVMGEAALANLVDSPRLSDSHREELRQHASFQIPHLQRRIVRRELLSEIVSRSLTDELFDRCVASGDREVQRELLSLAELKPRQLAILAESAANRALRQLARAKLSAAPH